MPFKVYVSHSVSPGELAAVYTLAEQVPRLEMEAFVPDRLWNPHQSLPARISSHLRNAQGIVVFATSLGSHMDWVNQEIDEGGRDKQTLAVIDQGILVSGFPEEGLVHIDRGDIAATMSKVASKLAGLKLEKEHREAVGWLTLGGLLLFSLLASQRK